MMRMGLSVLCVGFLVAAFNVSAEPASDSFEVEVRIGVQGVEWTAVVFANAEAIPETFLMGLAPEGRIEFGVDGQTPAGKVETVRQVLTSRGMTYIALAQPEAGSRIQVRQDGRVEVRFPPVQLHREAERIDPLLAELAQNAVVELYVDRDAPAGIFMGVSDAFKDLGVRHIRVH